MKPTRALVFQAVLAMSEVMPFFPKSSAGIDLIVEAVLEFVATDEQLDWFVRAAIRELARFDGVPQLRALFCTKYASADGIPPLVEVPGLTEETLEAEFHARQMAENDARLAEYRRQDKLLTPKDREPFLLPAAAGMPEPAPENRAAARKLLGPLVSSVFPEQGTTTRTPEETARQVAEVKLSLAMHFTESTGRC